MLTDLSPREADGFLGLRRRRLRIRYAGGALSAPFVYDEVCRSSLDAVVIAAHFQHEDRLWVYLRSAVRPPLALRDPRRSPEAEEGDGGLWELPAGLIDPGEQSAAGVLRAGARELAEELGFQAEPEELERLGPSVLPCPGIIAERQYFVAVHVDPARRGEPCLDGSALEVGGQVQAVALETALAWAREGSLQDAKTELGLRRLAERLGSGP